MRGNNKYLQKVQDELDIYRRHLLLDEELSPRQQETFDKMNIARGWLKQGYSDAQVIQLLRTDPETRLQERRSREVLVMAYDLYADIRLARNPEGVKYLYAEMFREAAQLAYQEARQALDFKDHKAGAELLKIFRTLTQEAAELDGAYQEKERDLSQGKKPTKIIIKRVTKNVNGVEKTDFSEEAHFEELPK